MIGNMNDQWMMNMMDDKVSKRIMPLRKSMIHASQLPAFRCNAAANETRLGREACSSPPV
jgi:hypothetical protein